ncbi:MAG: hypothetical protein HYY37_05130 [Candidatus Aenigmarchaeota archaeon]|nr:hypothetical protein [Candidatus Aenigmarchaeota archaeon]
MNYQKRILDKVDSLTAGRPELSPVGDAFRDYFASNASGFVFGATLSAVMRTGGIGVEDPLYRELFAAAEEADVYSGENLRTPQEFALI